MGRSADPRRAAEARIRSRGVNSFEVHDRAPWTAIAELADIPTQPCGRHCGDRSVRGSNPDLRAAVCLSCFGPWTAATAVVCCDPQSVGGVAQQNNITWMALLIVPGLVFGSGVYSWMRRR